MIGFCKSKQEFSCIMCPLIHMGVAILAPFMQKKTQIVCFCYGMFKLVLIGLPVLLEAAF